MTGEVGSARRRALLAGLLGVGASVLGGSLWRPSLARADDDAAAYEAAVWMRIPRIGVDSTTVDVGVTDGYYDVPWFDVGHHADSANPGEPGNSIFNGHVLTIGAGRVFYRLTELTPGDAIFVYTANYRTSWAVSATDAVADTDDTFLVQTDQPQVTLYTCTGRFNFLERSYAERLVVVGELVDVVERS